MTDNEREWDSKRRLTYWLKLIGLLTGAIVGIGAAARILGVGIDLETKTAARAEYDKLRAERAALAEKLGADDAMMMSHLQEQSKRTSVLTEKVDLTYDAVREIRSYLMGTLPRKADRQP